LARAFPCPGALEELYISRRAIATPGTMCIHAGEFTRDAYFFHMRRASASTQVERYFVADGSYLGHGDQGLFGPLSKLNVCWSTSESLEVYSDDGPSPLQFRVE
jgi:hypothetical protein